MRFYGDVDVWKIGGCRVSVLPQGLGFWGPVGSWWGYGWIETNGPINYSWFSFSVGATAHSFWQPMWGKLLPKTNAGAGCARSSSGICLWLGSGYLSCLTRFVWPSCVKLRFVVVVVVVFFVFFVSGFSMTRPAKYT